MKVFTEKKKFKGFSTLPYLELQIDDNEKHYYVLEHEGRRSTIK